MDAEYHGEERFSKLSIAYTTEQDRVNIEKALEEVTPDSELTPNIYTSDISNGRKVLVIEYHDDYDRDAGKIFEKLMKKLNITICT
jgi:hypothetical protein